MKTILVATDYSENAYQAVEYAACLAQKMHCRLILFHAFESLQTMNTVPANPPVVQIIKNHFMIRLEEIRNKLLESFSIEINCITMEGSVEALLPSLVDRQQADVVVMGIRGASPITHFFMGSTTTTLLRKATFPMITVPASYTYHSIRRILFASDFEPFVDPTTLLPLREIAQAYEAMVQMLYIPSSEKDKATHYSNAYWEEQLDEIKHGYTFLYEKDIIKGIEQEIWNSGADLLVMLPHRHTFFERLLERPHTEQMFFRANIPLLALTDKAIHLNRFSDNNAFFNYMAGID
ncbi:universal stress protein [Xanthocytophaga agilis]|uniref:Universal stress protein n=1 Tax=Xanthocytophaga agilis TaxID=3048010 RepID=A0AAE3UHV4_9BACT|nr:universal stress protein [Xanthocytophaga agilis]MDJ1506443.1 universal stress protein [Xanthocytophaga agilis]